MKIQYVVVFVVLTACVFYACKHAQKNASKQQTQTVPPQTNTPDKFTATLTFGSGGGFTGAAVKYIVSPQGNVTRIRTKFPADTTTLKKLSDKDLNLIFTDAAALNLGQMSVHQPGNMSYFIEYADKDLNNTLIWGDYKNPPPPDLADYYERVMLILREQE